MHKPRNQGQECLYSILNAVNERYVNHICKEVFVLISKRFSDFIIALRLVIKAPL